MKIAATAVGTPTPMPTFAPVVRPVDCMEFEGVTVGRAVITVVTVATEG